MDVNIAPIQPKKQEEEGIVRDVNARLLELQRVIISLVKRVEALENEENE